MTRFGVMKHLKLLEEAGLLTTQTAWPARSSISSTPSRSGSSTTGG